MLAVSIDMNLLGNKTFGKIKVLLWKSYHARKYFWVTTLIEALVPILIAAYITYAIATRRKQNFTTHSATYTPVINRESVLLKTQVVDTLAYTPDCTFTQNLLRNVIGELAKIPSSGNLPVSINMESKTGENELEKYIMEESQNTVVVGIVFHNINESTCTQVPNFFCYEIMHGSTKDTRALYPDSNEAGPNPNKDLYLESGLAGFQLIINEEYIKMKNPSWKRPDVCNSVTFMRGKLINSSSIMQINKNMTIISEFPYPEYESSPVPRDSIAYTVCLSIIIIFVAMLVPFINHVTEEKGNGTKALIMLHGVKEWIIWFSWFVHAVTVLAISLTIMAIILKIPLSGEGMEAIRFVPFLILWLLFMLYCIATMSFSFMFCAIFHQGVVASFFYLIVAVMEIFIDYGQRQLHIYSFSLLFCFFPTTAFSKAFDMITFFEEIGVMHPWKSITSKSDPRNPVSLLNALLMLVVDIILYTFLTYYISVINPGKHGIKKSPWYFLESFIPFLRSDNKELYRADTDWEENYEYIEPPSVDEEPSIQINSLYKEYGSFLAINGVEMEMYENEITVLLGHNGAGKTTLLGILAGLISPDGGSITYKDMNVLEDYDEFKKTLGISFQENRLFPYLSVLNHLLFYGMLKGYSWSEVTEEAENYLEKLEMYEERYSKMKNITDSMKRKLSLMISLMGDSKMLLLDQPTLGMDVQSKVMTWDFLMDIRQGRTIISTARDMHDAEKIANRVAIMESGVLVSYGTIAFLKQTFGAAYELSISTENGDYSNIADFVNSYIPNSTVKYETEEEILFKLQPSETSSFPGLFENLERNREYLEITNITLGYTTLEQMLLEIGSLSKAVSTEVENVDIISESQYVVPKEGISLLMLQFRALLKKKFLYIWRNIFYTLFRLFFPIVLVLLGVKIIEKYDFTPRPHLTSSLVSYHKPIVMFGKHQKSKQYDSYYSYIKEKNADIIEATNENILDELIDYGRLEIISYRKDLIIGFEIGPSPKVFYNQWMLHSLPIAITTYSNMMLRDASGGNDMIIESIHHPVLNIEEACPAESLWRQANILSIMLSFLFAFFSADILLFLFEFSSIEITRSLMHIQIISKVPTGLYWFTSFVFDFTFFVITVAVRIVALKLIEGKFKLIMFSSSFGILLGIILLFGVSGLLFVYVISFFLQPSKETIITLFVLNFFCSLGEALFMIYYVEIREFLADYLFIITIIEIILSLVPFFNYNFLIFKYMRIWFSNLLCQLCVKPLWDCQSVYKPTPFLEYPPSENNPFALFLGCIFLIVDIVIYFILLYFISSRFFDNIYNRISAKKEEDEVNDVNDDVRLERDEIQAFKESESAYNEVPLLVDGLRKLHFKSFQYHDPVEGVSFMVQNGMCFGILGTLGAGKSTILKMLSTEILPTSGDASIEGTSLSSNKKQYISMIGYCPQNNPLMDELTGKEMLKLIASLRGISGSEAENLINAWISFLKLEKYQDRYCGSYSGGNKRKLCIAIALIGNPKVVFLDEPTTDLDPMSTRRLHDIVKKCKQAGLVVILASPNMEECEVLCDRATILVRGRMFCIGTLKDLKKQFARGYAVTFKIHHDATSLDETYTLEENMMNAFNPRYCELIEEQRGLLRYHINDYSVSWSMLFTSLEEIKNSNPIVDEYIATNTTLNDIFIAVSQSEFKWNSSAFS